MNIWPNTEILTFSGLPFAILTVPTKTPHTAAKGLAFWTQGFMFDGVELAIIGILCAGITIGLLTVLVSSLHSIAGRALRVAELALRQRPVVGRSSGTNGASSSPCMGEAETPPPALAAPGVGEPIASRTRSFRVEVARDLLPRIHQYVTGFLEQHGAQNEAGGMLVGEYLPDETGRNVTFRIRGFIEAGPNADFSAGSIQFDTDYQINALRALRLEHPDVDDIGCIHRHPGSLDLCSSGDLESDLEAIKASGTKALVFGIITLNNSRRLRSSLFYRDFKIDFYLLAEETGLQYEPILPLVIDLPLVELSSTMADLQALRGPGLDMDLTVLRQLPGLSKAVMQRIEPAAGIILTASFVDMSQPLHIWIQAGRALRLFHQNEDGDRCELEGPWIHDEVGTHFWLSLLLHKARLLLRRSPTPAYRRHFGILENRSRLVAEVRAMQERYGTRAVLRRRGDLIFWDYTVHESGREFPVEVRYPCNYPSQPPEIYSVRRLPPSPHRLGDHDPCWIDYLASDWNPARDTAVICVHAAHRWFACLLVYLTLGRWPEGADD